MSARRPSLSLPCRCWEVLCLSGFVSPLPLPAPSIPGVLEDFAPEPESAVPRRPWGFLLTHWGLGITLERDCGSTEPRSHRGVGGLLLQQPPTTKVWGASPSSWGSTDLLEPRNF